MLVDLSIMKSYSYTGLWFLDIDPYPSTGLWFSGIGFSLLKPYPNTSLHLLFADNEQSICVCVLISLHSVFDQYLTLATVFNVVSKSICPLMS
jgi:hypothetical protein